MVDTACRMDALTTAAAGYVFPVSVLCVAMELQRRVEHGETRWQIIYSKGKWLVARVSKADVIDTGIDLALQSRQVLSALE